MFLKLAKKSNGNSFNHLLDDIWKDFLSYQNIFLCPWEQVRFRKMLTHLLSSSQLWYQKVIILQVTEAKELKLHN